MNSEQFRLPLWAKKRRTKDSNLWMQFLYGDYRQANSIYNRIHKIYKIQVSSSSTLHIVLNQTLKATRKPTPTVTVRRKVITQASIMHVKSFVSKKCMYLCSRVILTAWLHNSLSREKFFGHFYGWYSMKIKVHILLGTGDLMWASMTSQNVFFPNI